MIMQRIFPRLLLIHIPRYILSRCLCLSPSSSSSSDDDDTTRLKDDAYLLLQALLLVTNDLFNERYDKEDDGAS